MRNPAMLLATALSALLPVLSYADAVDPATVNSQPVKRAWLDVVMQDAKQSGGKLDDKTALSNLIRNELLSQEAIRLGIDKRPDFAAREEIRHHELLANLLVSDYLKKNPVSEEALKAEYENFKTRLGDKQYSVRHIQVKTEKEAQDIIAQLVKGADFAKLAKEKSLDLSSRDKGGQIGWVAKGALKPQLGDAISRLQKGLFNTVPLQTEEGWHVFKLEDVRDLKAPPYDQVKDRVRQRLQAEQINKLIGELRAKAKIEFAR